MYAMFYAVNWTVFNIIFCFPSKRVVCYLLEMSLILSVHAVSTSPRWDIFFFILSLSLGQMLIHHVEVVVCFILFMLMKYNSFIIVFWLCILSPLPSKTFAH